MSDRLFREDHPSACTCVACEARRSGHRPGRKVWRGRDVTPRRSEDAYEGELRKDAEWREAHRRRLRQYRRSRGGWKKALYWLVVLGLLVYSSWIGWGVWQDYQASGDFEIDQALRVITERSKEIPGELAKARDGVGSWFREQFLSEDDSTAPTAIATRTSTPTPTPIGTITGVSQNSRVDVRELEQLVHTKTNEARKLHGLGALLYDERLAAIARMHSEDMAQFDYFSHTNRAGEDPSDRAARAGFVCRKDYGSYYTEGIAENLFQNWLYSSITYIGPVPIKNWSSVEKLAESTVNGWMNSPGHRQNILNQDYDREGIGVAISSGEKVYITQNFC